MEYRDLLPFDEYLQRLFLPALSECSNGDRYDSLLGTALLFEALRWLEVGIDLKVFSISAGKKLIESYRFQLRKQYRLFWSELEYIFPELTRLHIPKIIEAEEFSPGATFENSQRISKQFEMLLELIARLNANPCAASLSVSLIFLRSPAWETLMAGSVTGRNIMDAMSGSANSWIEGHRGYVLGGCFHAFVHLEDMLDALDYQRRPTGVGAGDWSNLRQAAHEIHGWRFAFHQPEFLRRFTEVCSILGAVMNTELQDIGITVESDGLDDYVKDIIMRWRGLGEPAMKMATG